jgi:predicted PurR-regulated permease PerM
MRTENPALRQLLSKDLTDVLIRVGLVAFLVVLCVKIFAPFMGLMLWALILAVTLYPLHKRIAAKLGDRQGRAATVLVLAGMLLIGGPTVLLGVSFADHVRGTYEAFQSQSISVKPPPASVANWPLVGPKVHGLWSQAATDLPALLEKMQPHLGNFAKTALGAVANTAGAILQFLGSLIIAGIMLAYGRSGSDAMLRIMSRLTTAKKGPALHNLSTLTIRSVAMGVIGVAFIQALLVGIGFVWADVPAAGVLAVILLVMGIAQLPALILTLPVIGYIWWGGDGSTTHNTLVSVYLIVAGAADGFLKPVLLGRGVDVPMPIVLLGALGGMVSAGMIGLFVGAVLMALGYRIFMEWVYEEATADDEPAPATAD